MAKLSVAPTKILRVDATESIHKEDLLAVEEPLEIRVGYGAELEREQKSISITMRTPGHDFELAMGFLFTEGVIKDPGDIQSIKYCVDAGRHSEENIVRAELKEHITLDLKSLERHFYTSSSCGVCGKASIEAVESQDCQVIPSLEAKITPQMLATLPETLRSAQTVFEHTGGLHAAGLFDYNGNLIALREDVGRHNALDKLIGYAVLENLLPLHDKVVMVSGRTSFELVQKSVMAEVGVLAAVSAPSSLAVELANQFHLTLVGFLRGQNFNVYSYADRISL